MSIGARLRQMTKDRQFLLFFVISSLCFAGATWQLFNICAKYLTYPIVSEVYVVKEESVDPPAFSLCFPWIELLPWSTLNHTQDSWMHLSLADKNNVSVTVNERMTVRLILNTTLDMSDLRLHSWVRRSGSFAINSDPVDLYVEKFLKDDLVCFKTMDADAVRPDFRYASHQVTYGAEPGMTLGLTLSRAHLRHISKVVIFLTPRLEYPCGDADFPVNYLSSDGAAARGLFADNGSTVGITYAKVTVQLLPPPFRTRCFGYERQRVNGRSYQSQQQWVHECVNRASLRQLRHGSFTSTFRGNARLLDYALLSKQLVYDNASLADELDRLIRVCNHSSPGAGCRSVTLTPQLFSTRGSRDVTFTLYDMSGPETLLIFHPLTTVTDLYVQVVSVIGAWLGVSCLDVLLQAVRLVTLASSCRRRCRRRRHDRRSRH